MLTPSDRLFQRAEVYYYRRRVPPQLRQFFKAQVFELCSGFSALAKHFEQLSNFHATYSDLRFCGHWQDRRG